jgi:hypothetical protein
MDRAQVAQALIREAFSSVLYPGDDNLLGSVEGIEPYRVEAEFRGKADWTLLAPEFIDQAPGGLASALSFLSSAAFRFYIPAYMLADIDGKLQRADPFFHLTYGLDDSSRVEHVNPGRYGTMTWFDYAQDRFKEFDGAQRRAVAAYLEYKKASGALLEEQEESIDAALERFWLRDAA